MNYRTLHVNLGGTKRYAWKADGKVVMKKPNVSSAIKSPLFSS
jgi:hypothetical protein